VRNREGIGATRVRVRAPARLHFGFLDLNGGLGRRFGSLGMALEAPAIELGLSDAERLEVDATEPDRLRRYAEEAASFLGVPARGRLVLRSSIPAHAGFGSGTQLALSVAMGLARLHGAEFDPRRAAAALDRGNRSGIGLAAFLKGGLLLDGGRGADDTLPPIIARIPIPASWRVLLVLDTAFEGIHGKEEMEAFRKLPAFPLTEAAHLCHLTVMQILPAAANRDIVRFGRGVSEMQRLIGDHFASAQGGRFASPRVAAVLSECDRLGAVGIGQSSWGPTGFALVGTDGEAQRLRSALQSSGLPQNIALMIVKGRNAGARIDAPGPVAVREASL
jgi:beta-ribofuranosylaminobenzene 5'-phosphate synthase